MAWTEQLPSGRWRGLYRTPDSGKRSVGTFAHQRPAMNAAAAAEAEAATLGWRDPRAAAETWGSWVAAWWPTRSVEASTLKVDASRRDHRLLPKWSDVPLHAITRHDVRAWAAELALDGLSPATVQRHVALLSASLSAAVDAEILPTNPAARLRLGGGETQKDRYLSADEQVTLLEGVDGLAHDVVAVLLSTGLRWGEATGLHSHRVDLDQGYLRVIETWDDKNRQMKAYPKGRRIRNVPIPEWTAELLEPRVARSKRGLVLTTDGDPIGYNNWRNRAWVPAVRRLSLQPLTIHDLRHTYASTLIQNGVSLEEIGRLLGHVSPLTTRRYAHLAATPDAAVLAALVKPVRGADVGQDPAPDHSNVIQFRARHSS
jgi:integrase